MKSNSLIVPVTGSRKRVQVSSPFTWAKVHALVLKLRNVLPEPWQDVLPCNSIKDTKICIAIIYPPIVLLSPVIAIILTIAVIVFGSVLQLPSNKEGGQR